LAQELVFDYRTAQLNAQDRALCDYAAHLTLAPGQMTETHVVALRDVGFSDAQITVAAQVIGYFNYINRIADGLGVDPESWMTLSPEEWRSRKGRNYV